MASRLGKTEKQEYRRLAKKSLRALRDGSDAPRAATAARSILTAYDTIADASPHKAKWECASGCAYCCHMPVHLTAIEAALVAAHILEAFDDDARQAAAEKLQETAGRLDGLSETEFKDARNPCALLDDEGRCSVYTARPLACRGFHSMSADVCKQSFESNDVACDEARDRETEEACARLVVAMHSVSNAGGFGTPRYELNSALARLLRPGQTEPVTDVSAALAGARARPSPMDVPLERIIARFRER